MPYDTISLANPLFIPAEWEPQSSVWLTWNSMSRWWKGMESESVDAFAKLAASMSRYECVKINCAPEAVENARSLILKKGANPKNIKIFPNASDDVWCRDSGAVFAFEKAPKKLERKDENALCAIDFKYNSWGGKFPPWDADDALASKMAACSGAKRVRVENFICEGGALEFDGKGCLLTTECVLLNGNRNPNFTKEKVEKLFADLCGIKKLLWLKDGIVGDDTDGHIDNLARFTPNGKILAVSCGKENPSFKNLSENLEILKNFENLEGGKFEIIPLPLPDESVCVKIDGCTRELPASYANYLLLNGAVILPQFGIKKSDERAAEIISSEFPDREIVPFDCRIFLAEGGAVHCLTQQEPLLSSASAL